MFPTSPFQFIDKKNENNNSYKKSKINMKNKKFLQFIKYNDNYQ